MTTYTTPRRKRSSGGYSLVEVSLSVLILAVGLCSILAVFPVAISWGGKSMANMTGSQAANATLSFVDQYTFSGDFNTATFPYTSDIITIGDGTAGSYYSQYIVDYPSVAINRLYAVTVKIHRIDPNSTSQYKAEKDLLGVYRTYIYDRP